MLLNRPTVFAQSEDDGIFRAAQSALLPFAGWASSAEVRGEFAEEMRTALLKANYRLDADGPPELAERCVAVAQRLGSRCP